MTQRTVQGATFESEQFACRIEAGGEQQGEEEQHPPVGIEQERKRQQQGDTFVGDIEDASETSAKEDDGGPFADSFVLLIVPIIIDHQDVHRKQTYGDGEQKGEQGEVQRLYVIGKTERNNPVEKKHADVAQSVVCQWERAGGIGHDADSNGSRRQSANGSRSNPDKQASPSVRNVPISMARGVIQP